LTAICLTPTMIINQYISVVDLDLVNMIHTAKQNPDAEEKDNNKEKDSKNKEEKDDHDEKLNEEKQPEPDEKKLDIETNTKDN